MRIIIACSGAGGHLSAGLSIAKALRDKLADIEIWFFSSDYRIAKGLVEGAGFRFYRIHAKGLLNRNLFRLVQFVIGQVIGLVQSGWLLTFIQPRLIIGAGGYTEVGVVCLGRLFGIPTVLHEQNLIPGKANRLLAPLVDKVLVSFHESKVYFRKYNCIVTGMPVRFKSKLDKINTRVKLGLAPSRFTILVMGGSRGAHSINQLIVDMAEKLTVYKDNVQFMHLTGAKDYKFVKEAYMRFGFRAYVERFSTRMAVIYSSADLVISRSGSSSISEISFFGLPAVLIPYPYSRDRHQLRNAQVLAEKDAAKVITEDDISSDKLIKVITELINQPERLDNMARQSRSLASPDAAEAVLKEIEELIYPAPFCSRLVSRQKNFNTAKSRTESGGYSKKAAG